jgi:hypothetical protein
MNRPSNGVDGEPQVGRLATLLASIERLESLAETADLMGDAGGVERFVEAARRQRAMAIELLDD